jgi:hypothetical protein
MDVPAAPLVVNAVTTTAAVNRATSAAMTLPGDVCIFPINCMSHANIYLGCPTGTTCIANSDQCSAGGSGGGSPGGGSGGTTSAMTATTTAITSKSTVLPKTTSTSSGIITFNGPTTTGSSSSQSLTSSAVSSAGSTSPGFSKQPLSSNT